MKSQELCNYLERLRSARNMSQETFTTGVVSLRQYRRYLNGESDIPFQVVDQLSEKLGVQTINLLREIEAVRLEEQKEIDEFYNNIANYNFEPVKDKIALLEQREFVDVSNKMLFDHAIYMYKLFTNQISRETAATLNRELFNMNKIHKQSIFTEVEMFVLSSILDLSDDEKETHFISEKLKNYLLDSSSIVGSTYGFGFNLVIYRLSKYSGKNKNYQDVLEYCDFGIQRNFKLLNFYLMEYFFYFKSLAYYRMGDYEKYEDSLVKCFHALQLEGNNKKNQKFTDLIQKDFDVNLVDLVMEYYRKNSSD
ncbi:MAG: hypothetical protein CVV61_00730 [Tenericutes bacterium HGW-Tenericutes-6]|nr:MAG: hypothetical protein CVV61_00730 [Tenericutes bacterium HGW-Tenericutes-6]